ncbi:DUF421 domain-containing protein [Desulforamulus hydrothermalis]|uniref:YetF C-terminal domain-containing protein n=1 Tax=Desulforamulus hydrothermalis Lam5 = DSM 18033 TaxID=1121428 RepID=K8E762_9FIRM|nr:DUF421 domain-containing protein [Desulforamulus hydrothermalis]CCO07318.1 conserved membrane hypothetical protein [Desulforamulus hydrothermalis Lam5 = DSM 18033]SHG93932.1 Uncharacterized membrane protein YcaP, DUF421 family [Desulforamulus hydrothermalis Lam5 = DSM 18033]
MPEWLAVIGRSLGFLALVWLLLRLTGKRQISQLTLFDLVTVIVIGVTAAALSLHMIANPVDGLAVLAVWTLLPAILYLLAIKYKSLRDLIMGKETILINHGKVLEDKLMEARFTPEDLLSKLRQKNAFKVADVEFAVLEPNGEVSVMLKKQHRPVTAAALGWQVNQESVPQTVMLDGVIIDEHLTALGLNRNWLQAELEKAGVAPENVFIAQVDAAGQLYLDLFDDAIHVPQPKTKDLAYATLKKCQADCEMYALGTRLPKAKAIYSRCAEQLDAVISELKPLLKR